MIRPDPEESALLHKCVDRMKWIGICMYVRRWLGVDGEWESRDGR